MNDSETITGEGLNQKDRVVARPGQGTAVLLRVAAECVRVAFVAMFYNVPSYTESGPSFSTSPLLSLSSSLPPPFGTSQLWLGVLGAPGRGGVGWPVAGPAGTTRPGLPIPRRGHGQPGPA